MAQVTDLASAMTEAGVGDNLRKYMQARGINTAAVMAAIARDPARGGRRPVGPAREGLQVCRQSHVELSAMEIPVVKARLRHVRRACDRLINGAAKVADAAAVATAAAPSSSVAARVPKDLPAGYWQAQIQKYEAVTIAGEPRQFPQRVIIGAETIIARLAHEVKTETHTAVGLREIVQARYFNAAGEPNPLCSAKKTLGAQECPGVLGLLGGH